MSTTNSAILYIHIISIMYICNYMYTCMSEIYIHVLYLLYLQYMYTNVLLHDCTMTTITDSLTQYTCIIYIPSFSICIIYDVIIIILSVKTF